MERITLRITERQLNELEAIIERGDYPNRSEAIRAAVRDMVKEDRRRRVEVRR